METGSVKMDPDKWIKAEQQRRAVMSRFAQDNHAAAACEAMRRLAVKFPQIPAIQADLASLAFAVCEYRLALGAAERLVATASGDPRAMQAAVDVFLLCGKTDAALRAWKRLEKSANKHSAWLGLARMAERAGRLEEAAEWTAKALQAAPNEALAILQAGRLARRHKDFAAALRDLQRCAAEGVPPSIRAEALYEIGELHDALNDPAAAVAAWREAKRCMQEAWPAQVALARRVREKVLERNRHLVAQLQPEQIHRWRQDRDESATSPAVLVGHPRSGTTLLEQVLAAHPQILDVDEKDAMACSLRETLFPDTPQGPSLEALESATVADLRRVREDYLRRIQMLGLKPAANSVIVDKNPNLTDFLPFLLRPWPGLRIIAARRDPRDILLSCFRLPVKPETGNVGWLREKDAAEDYLSMISVWERLRECLGDDPGWLEVSYEALCQDFEPTVRKVTRFLALEWHERQQDYRQTRAEDRVASPSYEAVRNPVHAGSIGRWKRYAEHLPELFAGL